MTTKNPDKPVHIIGAGLAGSEAAWQCANTGVPVILHEMRGIKGTAAHKTDGCAELVCSNSFRSDDALNNAVGLLHAEMRNMNSLIMREGDKAAVPAGGALAVDRDIFSQGVTKALSDHPLITIERGEISGLPPAEWDNVIIATGPLTSDPLAQAIQTLTGEKELAFFDALAPIVHFESIDQTKTWFQSRYDKGRGKDYINCPMTEEEYNAFLDALLSAEYGLFKDWELPSGSQTLAEQEIDTPYFDGCMPIEIMAARGRETLRFGPMKPVGLTNPHAPDIKPYAIVQLRQDNALGTLYNIVGFQTKMKYGEQTRVFRMIPGLENAEFARLGGLHRNTFINSPKLLDPYLRLKDEYVARHYPPLPALASLNPPLSPMNGGEGLRERGRRSIRFAGQITGCEGYVESASIGLIAGRMAAAEILGMPVQLPPPTTAMGALLSHITGGAKAETFQPMNINFGLFPPLSKEETTEEYINKHGKTKLRKLGGPERKQAYCRRALRDQAEWLEMQAPPLSSSPRRRGSGHKKSAQPQPRTSHIPDV